MLENALNLHKPIFKAIYIHHIKCVSNVFCFLNIGWLLWHIRFIENFILHILKYLPVISLDLKQFGSL